MGAVFYTARVEGIEAYLWTHTYPDVALRPDGREVAYVSEIGGARRAWRRPCDGGPAKLLVLPADRDARRVAWSPDGALIAVGVADERVFVVDAQGRDARELGAREASPLRLARRPWAPDGSALAAVSGAGTLALLDVATGTPRVLYRAAAPAEAYAWSRDGRYLCAVLRRGPAHDDVVVVDRETGAVEETTADRPPARRVPLGFTSDGSSLYLVTDEGRENLGLARLGRRGRTLDWLKTPEWDIDVASMSENGRFLLYGLNEDAAHRLRLLDRNSGREPDLPAFGQGACGAIALTPDGARAALVWSASRRPPAIFVVDLGRPGVEEVTRGDDAEPPRSVDAEVVRYESFDRKIPALLYRPETPSGAGVIYLPPDAQARADWKPLVQFLAAKGLVVLVPNVRGTRGYGKTFERVPRGGDEGRDVAAAARHLAAAEGVDPGRVLLLGHFGRALDVARRDPKVWRAAIDLGGVAPAAPAPLPYLPAGEDALREAAEFLLAHA
jgi:dipeptidyl aminopeptidase/acylaminoacyl peptidase